MGGELCAALQEGVTRKSRTEQVKAHSSPAGRRQNHPVRERDHASSQCEHRAPSACQPHLAPVPMHLEGNLGSHAFPWGPGAQAMCCCLAWTQPLSFREACVGHHRLSHRESKIPCCSGLRASSWRGKVFGFERSEAQWTRGRKNRKAAQQSSVNDGSWVSLAGLRNPRKLYMGAAEIGSCCTTGMHFVSSSGSLCSPQYYYYQEYLETKPHFKLSKIKPFH